jgi:hypothetical protein
VRFTAKQLGMYNPDAWVTEKRRRRQERWEDFPEMMNARGEMERISPGKEARQEGALAQKAIEDADARRA